MLSVYFPRNLNYKKLFFPFKPFLFNILCLEFMKRLVANPLSNVV